MQKLKQMRLGIVLAGLLSVSTAMPQPAHAGPILASVLIGCILINSIAHPGKSASDFRRP